MKYLKYLIFLLFIVILSPNAYAYTYDVTNQITAPSGSGTTGGHYLGLEIYNSGSQNNYTVNTRYNGTLSEIIYNLPLPSDAGTCFTTNMDYTITMEMATEDWRNHFTTPFVGAYSSATNWKSSNVTFVSMKKIYFKFKIPSSETSCVDFVYVRLASTSLANTPFTGTSNWKLSKITLADQYSSSGGSSGGGGSSSTPTPDPNQSIIDNDNENTNNIIENNNNNTQQIIDSLNNKCSNMFNYNAYYRNYGSNITVEGDTLTLQSNNSWNWTVYDFELVTGKRYYFKGSASSSDTNSTPLVWVTYDNDDWNDRTFVYEQTGNFNYSFVAQHDHIYVRLYASKDTANTNYYYKVMFSDQDENYCPFGSSTNKIDETTNAINETNSYLQDDTDPSISDNDFMSMFNSIAINDPLSYLLTLPVQLINKIVSLSDTCTAVNLGTLYGTMLTLPCINLENILGSTVWNIIDVIFSVSLLVVVLKNLYDTFSNLLTMGAEKEAKEKFSMPTPMDFLSMILGGDR